MDAAVVRHAGTGAVEPLHRLGVVEHDTGPLEDRAARVVEAGTVGRRQPVVARRARDARFRSARRHDASSGGPLTTNLRGAAAAPIGRKVPAEGSDGPSGLRCTGAETGVDARRRPRDRASSARARSSPVRRGRRALGGRPRLLQAHRPLPRVRGGGARGRGPAVAADGRGGVPPPRVPPRLPGDRRAGGSRRGVRRPPPAAPDPACSGAPGPGPAPRSGRARRGRPVCRGADPVGGTGVRGPCRLRPGARDATRHGPRSVLRPAGRPRDRRRHHDGGPRARGSRPRDGARGRGVREPAALRRLGRDDPDLVRGRPARDAPPGAPARDQPRAAAPPGRPRDRPAADRRGRGRGQPDDARRRVRPRRPSDRPHPVPVGDRDRAPRGSEPFDGRRAPGPRARPARQPAGTRRRRPDRRQPRRRGCRRGPRGGGRRRTWRLVPPRRHRHQHGDPRLGRQARACRIEPGRPRVRRRRGALRDARRRRGDRGRAPRRGSAAVRRPDDRRRRARGDLRVRPRGPPGRAPTCGRG